MIEKSRIEKYNKEIIRRLGLFLNLEPRHIFSDDVKRIAHQCCIDTQDAYSYLLAAAMCFDYSESEEEHLLFKMFFFDMVHELDTDSYLSDPYMIELDIPRIKEGRWELTTKSYTPCEAFVCDDFEYTDDGRTIPQIGYFMEEYNYPCVLSDGREWMLITPNEINTMKEPIKKAHGRVLTFGLGLGYFAFMAARKDSVESVVVVECDREVISLFERYILPQMSCRDKISIVLADAYEYAEHEMADGGFDFVFADIWHDPSDGVPAYKKLRSYEHLLPNAEFEYWIEKTMKYYM